jgi:hypothetical protein
LRYYKTTCFASAKVLVFASTEVHTLTVVLEYIAFGRALARVPRRYHVYLLYQYQSTDTDLAACRRRIPRDVRQWLEWGCYRASERAIQGCRRNAVSAGDGRRAGTKISLAGTKVSNLRY